MKVKDVLTENGSHVVTVNENATVFEAMSIFAANRVGSLLVLGNDEKIVGIIAARDVLMQVLRACDEIKSDKVKEIMTRDIIVAEPDDDLETIQALMTNNRIRHVPIIEQNNLAGIISIGDVVKAQLKEIHVENKYLREYIEGKYPG